MTLEPRVTIDWCENGYLITIAKSGKTYVCERDPGEIVKASRLPEIFEQIIAAEKAGLIAKPANQ